MKIRTASPPDAPRIAEIQAASWKAAYRGIVPDAYLDALDPGPRESTWAGFCENPDAPIFLSLENHRITGFCHLSPSRDVDLDHAAEIIAIYLDPADWRKGHGRLLSENAITFARNHGYRSVTLWVLADNRNARHFYDSAGFSPDGTAKTIHILGHPLVEIRYRLDLGNLL